jgi:hypothetical protein
MAKFWIFLSTEWRLEDVQATLNVVISFLSVIAVWTFSRFCWQRSTSQVVKNHNVTLSSLLTVTTLGEVLDILRFLKYKALSLRHPRILLQCIVVTIFSVSAILSGPIARFSTRRGHITKIIEIDGFMATVNHSSIASAMVKWNTTQQNLIKANFPTDQLLDFLPNPEGEWLYEPDQWNSSWSANCTMVQPTRIDLVATDNQTSLFDAVPGIPSVIPERFQNQSIYRIGWDFAGFYNERNNSKDLLIFVMSTTDPWFKSNWSTHDWTSYSFSISAYHLHNAPRTPDDPFLFAPGPIEKSSYSRLDCDMNRIQQTPDYVHQAYPWTNSTDQLITAFADYYRANFVLESISNYPIQHPKPEDLFQFYQVYMITKDTQYPHRVVRPMSAHLRTVEISTVFLTIVLLIAFLIILGIANYSFFFGRHRSQLKYIPDSKLEWMLQAMKEAMSLSSSSASTTWSPYSPTTSIRSTVEQFTTSKRELRREYEDTMYGCFDVITRRVGPMRVQVGHGTATVQVVRQVEVPKAVEASSHQYSNQYRARDGNEIQLGYGLPGEREAQGGMNLR